MIVLMVIHGTHRIRMSLVLEKILPAIGPTADLPKWQQALGSSRSVPGNTLSLTMRGEWLLFSERELGIYLATAHRRRELVDPEKLAMAMARDVSELIAKTESSSLPELAKTWQAMPTQDRLSPEARELAEMFLATWRSCIQRHLESERFQAIHQAALELLMKEAGGAKASAEDAAAVTCDPLTGKPFLYDSATRTLDAPPDLPEFKLRKPIKLPW